MKDADVSTAVANGAQGDCCAARSETFRATPTERDRARETLRAASL